MNDPLLRQLVADARFYRATKYPDLRLTTASALATALSCKGWWLLALHRVAYYSSFNRNLWSPAWWLSRLIEGLGRYFCAMLARSEVMADCRVLGPVFFSADGYLIIGASEIGGGTVIHHRVTIGMTVANQRQDRPVIGQNVWIGSDCVIAGGLRIGDGATVLPGSYVTSSIPAQTVVKGNPARVVRKDFDNSGLRRSQQLVSDVPAPAVPTQ